MNSSSRIKELCNLYFLYQLTKQATIHLHLNEASVLQNVKTYVKNHKQLNLRIKIEKKIIC